MRLFSEKQISLLKDERRFLECGQHVIVPLSAARHKLGGPELLAKHLGVEDAALRAWIDGEQVPPAEIIHKAADLVLGDGLN